MDTLKLTDSSQKIDLQHRDRFFYDQYQYGIDFKFQDAGCMRIGGRTVDDYLACVERRWQYRRANKHMTNNGRVIGQIMGSWQGPQHDAHDLARVIEIATFLWHNQDQVKPIFYPSRIYLYFNEVRLVPTLQAMMGNAPGSIRQAIVSRPRGVVSRMDPSHCRRTFLRETQISSQQKINLAAFFTNRPDVKPSPGLLEWFNKDWACCRNYYWFDHDEDGIKLMLELVVPGLIRTTLPVERINT
jgi:hypothetical protein